MKRFLFLVWLPFASHDLEAQSNSFDANAWVANGTVNTMVASGSNLYLGGSFSHVGPLLPYGVALNGSTGLPNTAFPKPNGLVRAVIPDGSGGWYIGGDFTAVGGVTRNRLARINSDGSLHDWNPGVSNGSVYAIALSGTTVYVGGNFTNSSSGKVGGASRNRLAALDASANTNNATSWNPDVTNGIVYSIVVNGSTVYIGGSFTTVASTARNRIAALDASATGGTGSPYLTTWNPNAGNTVYALALSGGNLYVGGNFTSFGSSPTSTTRNRIAAFAVSTGALTNWDPSATGGNVNAIAVNGSTVYAAGTFTTIGGSSRNRLAALDATATGASGSPYLLPWNPNADQTINTLLVSGSTVYVGGDFANIGGQARARIAALDANATGAADSPYLTSWNPKAGGTVMALAIQAGNIFAGGSFTIIGGEVRNNLARFDAATGQADTWNPNVDAEVRTLALSGSTLYLGGDFTMVDGQTRNRVAAVDASTGSLRVFDPSVNNGSVRAIAVSGSTVYLGGSFNGANSINVNATRDRLAAVDATSGTVTGWNPIANSWVHAIALNGTTVYAGGEFTTIGGLSRKGLAAIDSATGSVTPSWDPNPIDVSSSGVIYALAFRDGKLYPGGNFTTIGGSARTYFAELLASTGSATAWNPAINNTVSAIAFSGAMVYVGRGFSSAGGSTRTNAAGLFLNVNTGNATPWYPTPVNFVYSIAIAGDKAYLAGSFNTVGSELRPKIAAYPITSVNWGGSAGGNWSDAANWAPGYAPTSSLDVAVTTGYPTLDADYTLPSGKTLTLSGTGSLRVAPGKRLTLAGTADFGGMSVTFRSSAIGTASLGQVTGTLTGATNVTVERYVPAGRKWRFLCAPLTGSSNNSVFYNWQNNDVVNGSTGVEIWGSGGHADPSSSNTGLALGGGASMRSYGSSGWQNVTNTNTTLLFDNTTNYGYALFQTGPYNNGSTAYIGSSGNIPAGVATTLSASGSLITGDHTKSLTATSAGQYFLVANPYASPVNPASFTDAGTVNRTNLDNVLYMWDAKPGNGINRGLGRYVAYDISTGNYSVVGAGTGFADNTVQIQSGQAFFVRASSPGAATLVFRESSKSATGAHDMFGSSTQAVRKAVHILLHQDSAHIDGAKAFFHAGAKSALDALDGYKLMNATDNLGLRREGKTLIFEHRPEIQANDTLVTSLTQMQAGAFRLRLALEGFTADDGVKAELVDRQLNRRTPLLLTDTTDLGFTVTADSASAGERFIVVFTKSAATGGGTAEPGEVIRMNPYPNPVVQGLPVRVDMDGQRAPWDMQLMDATGRLVWRKTVNDVSETQVRIDMSRMGAGVYQLLMTDAKGVQTVSRVVKP